MNELYKTIPDTSKARILIVGDVMLDRYWFGDVARISPEAPVPVVKVERTEERPGGAANVARKSGETFTWDDEVYLSWDASSPVVGSG